MSDNNNRPGLSELYEEFNKNTLEFILKLNNSDDQNAFKEARIREINLLKGGGIKWKR